MSHPDPARPHEHEEVEKSKLRQPHAEHAEAHLTPHNPKEINPHMASDIAYWSQELGVDGTTLHEIIRVHGTHVDKVRAAIAHFHSHHHSA